MRSTRMPLHRWTRKLACGLVLPFALSALALSSGDASAAPARADRILVCTTRGSTHVEIVAADGSGRTRMSGLERSLASIRGYFNPCDFQPSPDGSSAAAVTDDGDLYRATGDGATALLLARRAARHVEFSPDGKQIVFASPLTHPQIYRVAVAGG